MSPRFIIGAVGSAVCDLYFAFLICQNHGLMETQQQWFYMFDVFAWQVWVTFFIVSGVVGLTGVLLGSEWPARAGMSLGVVGLLVWFSLALLVQVDPAARPTTGLVPTLLALGLFLRAVFLAIPANDRFDRVLLRRGERMRARGT